jgi:NAD+ synthase
MIYAIANQYNYLVAGTGNYSELMCGYFTKFGDGGVDIEPIGQYSKTEVFEMAKLITEIPTNNLTKKWTIDWYKNKLEEKFDTVIKNGKVLICLLAKG